MSRGAEALRGGKMGGRAARGAAVPDVRPRGDVGGVEEEMREGVEEEMSGGVEERRSGGVAEWRR
jgi:hypothetical protein